MAELVYAVPFSIGKVAPSQADLFGLQMIEIVQAGVTVKPTLPAVEAFVYKAGTTYAYPLVKRIDLAVRRNLLDLPAGDDTDEQDVCEAAAEIKHFLAWCLTSSGAKSILSNFSIVRVPGSETSNALSEMKCRLNEEIVLVDDYIVKDRAHHSDEEPDHDLLIILGITGSCFGSLLLVVGIMVTKYCLGKLAEVKYDVWKITEFDLVPPESEGIDSFIGSITQISPQHLRSEMTCMDSNQHRLRVPNLREEPKLISGIYKSVSISLEPTRILSSSVFDYQTRETLVNLRKLSHTNLQRFYGLADLSEKRDALLTLEESGVDQLDPNSPRETPPFEIPAHDTSVFYLVTEGCTGKSLFNWLHCSTMCITDESKISIILNLVSGMDYLHGKGMVHGKLNSLCCYYDHNYSIKIGDWQCMEKLETYRRLHSSDVYTSSRLFGYPWSGFILKKKKVDRKGRKMNVRPPFQLRWRPPECLWNEVPVVRSMLKYLDEESRRIRPKNELEIMPFAEYDDSRVHETNESADEAKNEILEITLSHFQAPTVDVYSLGVLVNEVWTRAMPFSHADLLYGDETELLEAIGLGDVTLQMDPRTPEIVSQ